jgi:hypothetical protein
MIEIEIEIGDIFKDLSVCMIRMTGVTPRLRLCCSGVRDGSGLSASWKCLERLLVYLVRVVADFIDALL